MRVLLLLFSSGVFCLETEDIKAVVRVGKNNLKCSFHLVWDEKGFLPKKSSLSCLPKKKKAKLSNFKLKGTKASYVLSFTTKPPKITKGTLALVTTPTPTPTPTSSPASCPFGFSQVCTQPSGEACDSGSVLRCFGFERSQPDATSCSCLPTVLLEASLSSSSSPLGHCHQGCLCIPASLSSCSPCSPPPDPPHGSWHCQLDGTPPTCTLDCLPGFISGQRSATTCQSGTWSPEPSLYSCRPAVALVTGGSGFVGNRVELYAGDLTCSADLPTLPDQRSKHTLDLVGDEVVICGSIEPCLSSSLANLSVLTVPLQGLGSWTNHSWPLEGRTHHVSLVQGDNLVLLGGGQQDQVWDGSSWENLQVNTYQSIYGACVVKISRRRHLVLGGNSQSTMKRVLSMELQDGGTWTASLLPDLSIPRRYHACSLARNATFTGVLVTGGREGGLDGAASSELYDLATNTSARVGDLVVPRFGHMMILLGERTFAMAGWGYTDFNLATGMEQNSVEEFSLTSQAWEMRQSLMSPRRYAAITAVPWPKEVCGSDDPRT